MPDRIAIVVASPLRERLQLAGMAAAVASVSGSSVRIFVSMNALACFLKDQSHPPASEGPIGELLHAREPDFERFFADAVELGDTMIFPCSTAFQLLGVRQEQLADYFGGPLGMTGFLEMALGGQVWSF